MTSSPVVLLRSRPVWFTLLIALLVLAYQIWIGIGAAAKLSASGLDGNAASSNIEIDMTIDPEQFHMVVLQDAGRLVKVDKRRAYLKQVPRSMIEGLARLYWIERISPWKGGVAQ